MGARSVGVGLLNHSLIAFCVDIVLGTNIHYPIWRSVKFGGRRSELGRKVTFNLMELWENKIIKAIVAI